jgi:RHS repeat-associated protein
LNSSRWNQKKIQAVSVTYSKVGLHAKTGSDVMMAGARNGSTTIPDREFKRNFTGKEYEDDLNLYYFNARWYDPQLGRFLSEDPAGIVPGDFFSSNEYIYCRNNPVGFVDPDGRSPVFLTRLSVVARSAGNYLRSPVFQQKMANATISFAKAYGTARLMGESRFTAAVEGSVAFGTGLFNIPGLSNPCVKQAATNIGTQMWNLSMNDTLTYKDFSISSLGYSTLAGGAVGLGLNSLNIAGRIGGITGVLAEAPFDLGLGASFSGLGQAFGPAGTFNYSLGNGINSVNYGLDTTWNNFMNRTSRFSLSL